MTTNEKPQEVIGIETALSQIEKITERLIPAVLTASNAEKDVERFRVELNKKKDDPLFSMLLKAQPELVGKLEGDIVNNSRKAVSDILKEVSIQQGTINTLSAQLRAKYGLPEVTVKNGDRAPRGSGQGNVTDHNKSRIEALLKGRGFNPAFVMLDDGIHYEVQDGTGRHNRYTSNIERDWQ